ncbi:MAG: signal peptidase I [archaeon]
MTFKSGKKKVEESKGIEGYGTWNTVKRVWKKVWFFLWHSDSAASWIANIIIAFLLIRFVVYPLLGLMLGTTYPVVAVVSESMEHGLYNNQLCGQEFSEFPESFDSYWNICGYWYEENGISKEEFEQYPLKNGFNRGDIIVLRGAYRDSLDVGDVLVFQGPKPQPIIHRVVNEWEVDGEMFYQTKGDHNRDSFGGELGETEISEDRIIGKGWIRIPYLGWIKILFVDLLSLVGFNVAG